MTVAASELEQIEAILAQAVTASDPYPELRRRFPGLSWTRCDASDVNETPFRSYPAYDLHLLDRSAHCVQITSDPAQATGFLLARKDLRCPPGGG